MKNESNLPSPQLMETEVQDLISLLKKMARGRALELVEEASWADKVKVEIHPLGMLVTHFIFEGFSIRLHIWTPTTKSFQDEFGQIHDHIWHLESHVLMGSLEHTMFEVQRDGITNEKTVWVHNYEIGTLQRLDEKIGVQASSRTVIPRRGSYQMEAGIFHQTRAIGSWAVTLVKARASHRHEARMLGGPDSGVIRDASRVAVPMTQVLDALTRAQKLENSFIIGPFPITLEEVLKVPQKPGIYLLATKENRALYIGNADVNLQGILKLHLEDTAHGVAQFWYKDELSPARAYELECQWYHFYAPTHNLGHPSRFHFRCQMCNRR